MGRAEWLPQLPKHWETKPLKYLTSVNDEVLPETTFEEAEISYVEISDVSFGRGVTNSTLFQFGEAPSQARRVVRDGDLIVSTVRTYLKAIASVEQPDPGTVVSTGFAVLRPREINSAFLSHMFHHDGLIGEIISRSVGVSYPAISAGEIMSLDGPVPPLPEQRIIAAYLGRETARIDGLVERLIALLTEKRQATVSHAFTKGLDSSAPMKDSGIDWLGEVPAHWEERRLYTSAKFVQGKALEPFFDDEGEYACATARFVSTGGDVNRFSTENLTPAKTSDILMVISDLPNGRALARAYLVSPADSIAINQRVCGITVLDGDPRYFAYQLNRHEELLRYNDGSNQTHLKNSYFTQLSLRFPPVSEQTAIADHLNAATVEIDHLKTTAGTLIERTKERRAAVISAAVTGQIPLSEMEAV